MPKVKIVGMPTVRIVDVPKAVLGLEVNDTTTMAPVADKPRDINGCIIGEEIYDLATGICQPIEGGYNPKQDEQKNQPAIPVTNSSGETVGGPASTSKTGPGTGVNPSQIVKPGDCAKGWYKNSKGECVPEKKLIQPINDFVQAGLAAGNVVARVFENKEAKKAAEATMRRKSWNTGVKPGGAMAFGKTQLNEGVEFPNMLTPPNDGQYLGEYFGKSMGEFGGSFPSTPSGPVKIKIIGEPDTEVMKYGGQSNYGFDSGWRRSFTDMNKISADYYKNTMSEDKSSDEKPVLEAEGGETLYKPGDQEFYNLEGNKHSDGGIELTGSQVNSKSKDVPSFIYSDTPSMKIKDKEVLNHFGITYKKGGVTPAEISKKYDLNKFKAILQDPNSDELAKSTAQLMIDKNERRLAELATIQEKMKGLKAPKFAENTLKHGSAAFGGFVPFYAEGGATDTTTVPPSANPPANKSTVGLGEWTDDYEKLESTLMDDRNKPLRTELFNRYKKQYPNSPVTEDQYIQNLLNAQKQNFAIRAAYGDDKYLQDEDWDKGGSKRNKRYQAEIKKLGMTPLTDDEIIRFQAGYRDLEQAMHEPDFFQTFGKYFRTKQFGKADEPAYLKKKTISKADKIYGNTTAGQVFELSGWTDTTTTVGVDTTTTALPATEPRYMCYPNPDGKGGGTVKQLPAGSTGGYTSAEEAAKHCPGPPKKYPFDYLLPDKVNMLAHAAIFPRQIFPYIPDMAYNKRPLALEDWRAKAAQRFATQYAAPSAQLATFGPTQGLGANLSFLAGQTGAQMAAEDIAPTISRNIDRVNAYNASEGQRQDQVDLFNLQNKSKRWEGYATTLQNYDNAMRQYLKENSDAFTRAWKNRMHLGEINDTNPNFFMNPTSGRQTWKGNAFYTGNTSDSGSSDLGKMYSLYYQKNMDDMASYITDEAERKKAANALAMKQIEADRYTEYNDPYSNRSRRRSTGFDFES